MNDTTTGRLNCSHCGAKIAVPPGHSRAKIRCPACGYYVEVPPELRSSEPAPSDDELPVIAPAAIEQEPPRKRRSRELDTDEDDERPTPRKKSKPTAQARANPNPKDVRPDFALSDDAPLGPNALEGTQDEDDDKPYAVPGDGMKRCRECGTKLPLDAKICVHCGVDFQTKKKQKKAYQTINREWEPRFDLQTRLKIFGGLQILNLLFTFVIANYSSFDRALLSLIVIGALQAFLIGSFEKLSVFRNAKGQATLTKHWRLAFIPLPPQDIAWKQRHGIGVIAGHSMGLLEWFTMFVLLFPIVIPGILFYIFVLHPHRYNIVLCDVYGSTEERIFQTTNQEQADEIGEVVSTATGLNYRSGQ